MLRVPKLVSLLFGAGLVIYMAGEVFEYMALQGCDCYQPTVFVLLGVPIYVALGIYLIVIGLKEGDDA